MESNPKNILHVPEYQYKTNQLENTPPPKKRIENTFPCHWSGIYICHCSDNALKYILSESLVEKSWTLQKIKNIVQVRCMS